MFKNKKINSICFLNPTSKDYNEFCFEPWMKAKAARYQPLGPLSIAGHLLSKNEALNISIFDADVELTIYLRANPSEIKNMSKIHDELLKEFLLKNKPDVIGVSCLFHFFKNRAHNMASLSKEVFPDRPVVFGGGYPSGSPEIALKDKNIDFIVEGEGENRFEKLLKYLQGEISVTDLDGIYSNHHKPNYFPANRDCVDIKNLPLYPLRLIKYKEYVGYPKERSESYIYSDKVNISIYASRGCPNRCTYCSSGASNFYGKYRPLPVEKIVEDILKYKEMGVDEFCFLDENPTGSPKYFKYLIAELQKHEIDYNFVNLELDRIDDEILKLYLSNYSDKTFSMGIESGSDYVLKEILNRRLSKEKIMEKMNIVRSCTGDETFIRGSFMIGVPGETKEMIDETIEFALALPIDWAVFSCFMPFPGTPLYDTAVEKGYFDISEIDYTDMKPENSIINMPHLKAAEISFLRNYANYKVNFIDNKEIQSNPKKMLNAFSYVETVVSEHCFAFWGMAQCYKVLGEMDLYRQYLEKAISLSKETYWASYMEPLFGDKVFPV